MVTGDTGPNGLAAPKPVDQGQGAGQGSVTTQLQLMEAETVKNQAVRQKIVTQTIVQVKPFIKCQVKIWHFPRFLKVPPVSQDYPKLQSYLGLPRSHSNFILAGQ